MTNGSPATTWPIRLTHWPVFLGATWASTLTLWAIQSYLTAIHQTDFAVFVGQDPRPDLSTPIAHLLYAPLARLPLRVAGVLWLFVGAASLFGSCTLVSRTLRLSRPDSVHILLIACASSAVITVWYLGQVTWLLLPLVTLAWREARADRPYRAAVFLACVALLKPPLALLLCALPWRAWSVAILVALTVIGLDLPSWLEWATTAGSVNWQAHLANASLYGWLTRTWYGVELTPALPARLHGVWLTVVFLIGTVTAWTLRHAAVSAKFSGWLLVALLVSPLGWIYYLPVILGPLAEQPRTPVFLGALLIGLIPPYPFWGESLPPLALLTLGSAAFWQVLILWVAVIRGT